MISVLSSTAIISKPTKLPPNCKSLAVMPSYCNQKKWSLRPSEPMLRQKIRHYLYTSRFFEKYLWSCPLYPLYRHPIHHACLSNAGRIGIERIRTPVAAKIALEIAGATAIIGVSPAPTDGMSVLLTRWISIWGTSLNRGT